MKFLVLVIPARRADYESGVMPNEAEIRTMMTFNEELGKAGVLLALDGLHPSSKGARLSYAGGKSTVTDGPFTEAKELIGGFWLWQCKSREEALAWAQRAPMADGDLLEVRQVFDQSDFGELGPEIEAKRDVLRKGLDPTKVL